MGSFCHEANWIDGIVNTYCAYTKLLLLDE